MNPDKKIQESLWSKGEKPPRIEQATHYDRLYTLSTEPRNHFQKGRKDMMFTISLMMNSVLTPRYSTNFLGKQRNSGISFKSELYLPFKILITEHLDTERTLAARFELYTYTEGMIREKKKGNLPRLHVVGALQSGLKQYPYLDRGFIVLPNGDKNVICHPDFDYRGSMSGIFDNRQPYFSLSPGGDHSDIFDQAASKMKILGITDDNIEAVRGILDHAHDVVLEKPELLKPQPQNL
jgi:hypothetical protein